MIYADYRGAKWWHPMLKRILDDIDYQKYDITLVSQIVRNAAQIKVLQALNKISEFDEIRPYECRKRRVCQISLYDRKIS